MGMVCRLRLADILYLTVSKEVKQSWELNRCYIQEYIHQQKTTAFVSRTTLRAIVMLARKQL